MKKRIADSVITNFLNDLPETTLADITTRCFISWTDTTIYVYENVNNGSVFANNFEISYREMKECHFRKVFEMNSIELYEKCILVQKGEC